MVTGAENSGGSILKARDYKLGHSPLSAVLAKVGLRRRTLAEKILRRRTSVFRTKAYGPRQVLAWSIFLFRLSEPTFEWLADSARLLGLVYPGVS